jgi:hypothetical protein
VIATIQIAWSIKERTYDGCSRRFALFGAVVYTALRLAFGPASLRLQ